MTLALPIQITNGKDPDSGEECKVLKINNLIVPFWLHKTKIELLCEKFKDNSDSRDPLLIQLMDSFLKIVSRCINRRLALSELISAIETGEIIAGDPP